MHFPLGLSKMGRIQGHAQPGIHILGHSGLGLSQVRVQLGWPLHLVQCCSPGHFAKINEGNISAQTHSIMLIYGRIRITFVLASG